MKNHLLRSMLVVLLGLTVNSLAAHAAYMPGKETSAPDRVGHVDLGVGVAGAFNDGADDSVFVSAAVAYGVTPYLAVGVEGGWQEADSDSGDLTIGYVPILADIIIRIPTVHEAIVPYGVLGLGGAGVYVEDSNNDDTDDTGFAWKLGAGFDWFLNTNWIFNFEFAYWDADVDLPNTGLDNDFSFWTIGVGLKYLF